MGLARTGAQAVLHHPGTIADEDFLATLANALILGGVSMAVAGSSRPVQRRLPRDHARVQRDAPDGGQPRHRRRHGRAVRDVPARQPPRSTTGAGTARVFDQLNAAFVRHGLPRTPAEVGLTSEQFAAVVQHAPATRPGRFTILEHLQLDTGQIAKAVEEYIVAVG